jgi:hypothetical protein
MHEKNLKLFFIQKTFYFLVEYSLVLIDFLNIIYSKMYIY